MSSLSDILTKLVANVQQEVIDHMKGNQTYEQYIQNSGEHIFEALRTIEEQEKELMTNTMPF